LTVKSPPVSVVPYSFNSLRRRSIPASLFCVLGVLDFRLRLFDQLGNPGLVDEECAEIIGQFSDFSGLVQLSVGQFVLNIH